MTKHDVVESPDHYTAGGIETINYMQAKLTNEQFEGYLAGSLLKYTSRYRRKDGVQDLKKARWFLNKLIDLLEA
jgi:hypothetical protein